MPMNYLVWEASMLSDKLMLDAQTMARMVETKVTCPFLGSVATQELLSIRGSAKNPLAAIEDVRRLGNEGGGDLGDLLAFFATGNHALMRSDTGDALDEPAPAGLFSLELPGSQGSHPGHSGILQGDPRKLASGRLSKEDFARLVGFAKGNFLKRSDVGRFIAENLTRDASAKVTGHSVAELLAHDLGAFVEAVGPALISRLMHSTEQAAKAHQALEQKLTKLLGEDNLVGSAGEFGLLFAFLAPGPDTKSIDGEPALFVDNVEAMFVHKRLPNGWETWKKSRADWVVHTTWLVLSADKEYRRLTAG
jgi:hypothetical protein